jgi:glycyl-tRNA synthetase
MHVVDSIVFTITVRRPICAIVMCLSIFFSPCLFLFSFAVTHRADKLVSSHSKSAVNADSLTTLELDDYILENKVSCPSCGVCHFSPTKKFNLMFKTNLGATDDATS